MEKFRVGERIAHRVFRHGTKGTVVDRAVSEGTLSDYEYLVHWDAGHQSWMAECDLESIEGKEEYR